MRQRLFCLATLALPASLLVFGLGCAGTVDFSDRAATELMHHQDPRPLPPPGLLVNRHISHHLLASRLIPDLSADYLRSELDGGKRA